MPKKAIWGLKIKQNPLEKILDGAKTLEVRGRAPPRDRLQQEIALLQTVGNGTDANAGKIRAKALLHGSRPVTWPELLALQDRHKMEADDWLRAARYYQDGRSAHVWELEVVQVLRGQLASVATAFGPM